VSGLQPDRGTYASFLNFTDPDGNGAADLQMSRTSGCCRYAATGVARWSG
jgi:hypothetical protein